MKKAEMLTIISRVICCALACGLLAAPVHAEKIPGLDPVPNGSPPEVRDKLLKLRAQLESDLEKFVADAKAFDALTAEQQSDAEYQSLQNRRKNCVSNNKAFNCEVAAAPRPGTTSRSGYDYSGDPMVVDLRDRVRDTVNLAVVSGGLPPASQARVAGGGELRQGPPPKLEGVSRQIATNPRFQEAHVAQSIAHLRQDQAREDKAMADCMKLIEDATGKSMDERFTAMLDLDSKKAAVDEVHDRLVKEANATLLMAHKRYAERIDSEVANLRRQGLIKESDWPGFKMASDSIVRDALNNAIIDGLFHLVHDYQSAYNKSLLDFDARMKDLAERAAKTPPAK